MNKWLQPIILQGHYIELKPLEKIYAEDLVAAAADGKLWDIWYTSVPSEQTVNDYIADALQERDKNLGLPFVIIHKPSNKIIGSTRFCNATPEHRRLEIGYTWYSKTFQRTAANTECKLLLLTHAFETLDCIAVEFKTNWFNFKSREAILRLGAKQDGVLRHHRLNSDGSYRDTVVFSITNDEWPAVKNSLVFKLKGNKNYG